jgi:hypothetical protein
MVVVAVQVVYSKQAMSRSLGVRFSQSLLAMAVQLAQMEMTLSLLVADSAQSLHSKVAPEVQLHLVE